MALLVATRDKTTGADGSWRFGVTAGVAKKDAHVQQFNTRVASLPFLSRLGPLTVKYILYIYIYN